jgi:hypothetical protein
MYIQHFLDGDAYTLVREESNKCSQRNMPAKIWSDTDELNMRTVLTISL